LKDELTYPAKPAETKVQEQPKTTTVVIQIDDREDALTQEMWAEYVDRVDFEVVRVADDVMFSGCSRGDAPSREACWVVCIFTIRIEELKEELLLAKEVFGQVSIAVTIGETQFI